MSRLFDSLIARLPVNTAARLRHRLPQPQIASQVLNLALPSVMEQSLITLVGLVDIYIVGHLGASAIAGVGLGGQVMNLIAAVFAALGVGATAVVARTIGARDAESAQSVAAQGLLVSVVAGGLISAGVFLYAHPLIELFGGEPQVIEEGAAWLKVAGPSFLFMGLMLVGNAILRGAGDTRTPLAVMVVVNIVNIAVAAFFTRVVPWGVAGTALGVALSYLAGGSYIIFMLFSKRPPLQISPAHLRPNWRNIQRILHIGLPAGMEQFILQFALSYSAVLISGFGTAAYAAHQIVIRLSALSYLPGWGFSVATTTLVGQELGAGNPEGAKAYTQTARWFSLAIMSVMGVVLFVFARPITAIFTNDPRVIEEGVWAVRIAALIQPIMSQSFIFGGALRGAGDTRITLIITMCTVWGLRILCIIVFGQWLGLGLAGAWIGTGVDFMARYLFFQLRFRTGRWAMVRV